MTPIRCVIKVLGGLVLLAAAAAEYVAALLADYERVQVVGASAVATLSLLFGVVLFVGGIVDARRLSAVSEAKPTTKNVRVGGGGR